MTIAAIILSTIALVISLASIVWHLAKHFSSHQIQMVPVSPFRGQDPLSEMMGKDPMKDFREVGEPLDEDEMEYFDSLKTKK